ncbi:hypothetical protein [Parvularcula dongshanensis]|uniref:Uncharacterized protein n=1 Tax=Parvularcula dongshanensis TaxID=1173995 RepID=A0A840I6S1_9PROT|nr:hypothetical protein [Parvularcula dongshanensis]MBB4659818.1 hypothetical protein [Parvularcula dongshanensis]
MVTVRVVAYAAYAAPAFSSLAWSAWYSPHQSMALTVGHCAFASLSLG